MVTACGPRDHPSILGWSSGRPVGSLPGMTTTTPPTTLTRDGAGRRLEIRGGAVTIRAATPALTLTDHELPAGFGGPPLHVHAFDEVFFVLAGRLKMRLGDEVIELDQGSSVVVPGDVPHTFAAEEAVRFLCAMTPGGFERYFEALAAGDEERARFAAEAMGYRPA